MCCCTPRPALHHTRPNGAPSRVNHCIDVRVTFGACWLTCKKDICLKRARLLYKLSLIPMRIPQDAWRPNDLPPADTYASIAILHISVCNRFRNAKTQQHSQLRKLILSQLTPCYNKLWPRAWIYGECYYRADTRSSEVLCGKIMHHV